MAEDEGDPSGLADVLFSPAQARVLLDSVSGRQPDSPLPIQYWPNSRILYTVFYRTFVRGE